jgi:hypothetical protein
MRFFVAIILIAILSAVAEYFLPWWTIAVVSFLVSLFAGFRPGRSFLLGFIGVGICWLVVALMHDIANQHILSTRMAALFHLPNYVLFIVVTVFLGALIGGLSACVGALFSPKR